MEDSHKRLFATIPAVLAVAVKWPDRMTAPSVQTALRELERLRAAILEIELQLRRVNGMAHATSQTHTWADKLREDMMVLASYAELHLTDELLGKALKLRVPHKSVAMTPLVKVAREFDEILRPHQALLIEKGMRPELLDETFDGANQIAHWWATRKVHVAQQRDLRREQKRLISQARKLIKLLGRELGPELRKNTVFRTQFTKAVTTTDKPGPKRSVRNGFNLKRRERAAPHAIPPERLSGTDTPAQSSPGAESSGEAQSQGG